MIACSRFASLVATVVIVSAGSVAADDKSSFTVHIAAPKAGAKWTEEKTEASVLSVDVNGKKMPVKTNHNEKKSIEVLKVAGGAVTEANYTYVTFTDTSKLANNTETTKPSPIAGKSYKLTAGTPLGVTASSGKVGDDELALVRKTEKRFGKPDHMDKVLDGKTFARDKVVVLPAAEIADAMGDDPEIKVASMSLTYRGMDGANASFDIALKMEGDKNSNHMALDLTGKLALDAKSGELRNLDVKGSLKATGAQAIEGTIELTEQRVQ